jgi:hypothetical protein
VVEASDGVADHQYLARERVNWVRAQLHPVWSFSCEQYPVARVTLDVAFRLSALASVVAMAVFFTALIADVPTAVITDTDPE